MRQFYNWPGYVSRRLRELRGFREKKELFQTLSFPTCSKTMETGVSDVLDTSKIRFRGNEILGDFFEF